VADPAQRKDLEHECADVLMYLMLIADKAGFDLVEAAAEKLKLNESRYPVEKAKGKSTKYSALSAQRFRFDDSDRAAPSPARSRYTSPENRYCAVCACVSPQSIGLLCPPLDAAASDARIADICRGESDNTASTPRHAIAR